MVRSHLRLARLLATGAVLLGLAATTAAGPAGATVDVTRVRFHEATVSASSTETLEPCVSHDVFVLAGRALDDGPRLLYVEQTINTCTRETLAFVWTTVTPERLTITPSLARARLVATVPVVDHVTGEARSVRLDLTFEGTGRTVRGSDHQAVTLPGDVHSVSTTWTRRRDATVSGTPDIFTTGELASDRFIQVQVRQLP